MLDYLIGVAIILLGHEISVRIIIILATRSSYKGDGLGRFCHSIYVRSD